MTEGFISVINRIVLSLIIDTCLIEFEYKQNYLHVFNHALSTKLILINLISLFFIYAYFPAIKFQENLLKTMIQIENTFFELGRTCERNCLIICDRGAMDASAYISKDKWEKLIKDNSWNNIDLRDNRYNQIIHMVSAANGAEEYYSTEDHSCRSEGVELAKELDANAANAWVGHPYFDVIDNSTDFEGKIRRMIGAVCQKMCIDTGDRLVKGSRKLKFLIKGPLPDDSVFQSFQDFEVVHTYLQTNAPTQVRLRKRGQKGERRKIREIRYL